MQCLSDIQKHINSWGGITGYETATPTSPPKLFSPCLGLLKHVQSLDSVSNYY